MRTEERKLGFFSKAYMYDFGNKGLVLEKERHVVCVYATTSDKHSILAAIPLCDPKYFKGYTFKITEPDDNSDLLLISAKDIKIVIDYGKKCCAINNNAKIYGSDAWGEECSTAWSEEYENMF